jgi:hypothetical protein
MEIRSATIEDRAAVVGLLKEFHASIGAEFLFDPVRFDALFRNHLAAGLVLILGVRPHGVLMAAVADHPYGMGRMAQETFWYVRDDARGRHALPMIDAYEAWAVDQGCVAVEMTSLAANDVSALYRRRGFHPVETHFLKPLRSA